MTHSIPETQVETQMIETIPEFANLLMHWHKNCIDRMDNLLQIPEGIEASLNDGQGNEKKVTLSGDAHTAFLIGVTVALSELRNLPFAFEQDAEVTDVEVNVSTSQEDIIAPDVESSPTLNA